MGQHNRYGRGEPVAPGTIVGVGGDILAQPGEFNFAEEGPRHDEMVYELWQTVQPAPHNRKIGETFGIELPVKPGWMFCTAKIPGEGNPDDCMLVYLRGHVAPPAGTRFAVRMLPPVDAEKPESPAAALAQNPEAAAVVSPYANQAPCPNCGSTWYRYLHHGGEGPVTCSECIYGQTTAQAPSAETLGDPEE
jgi:hypothetical protein